MLIGIVVGLIVGVALDRLVIKAGGLSPLSTFLQRLGAVFNPKPPA